jgi:hypothetical protein
VTRLMAERRADKHLADLSKLGTGSASALYRARPFALQPFDSSFISPCVSVHTDMVSYNTDMVKPSALTSYWDILDPKWKGKIASMDPRAAGGREGRQAHLLPSGAWTAIFQTVNN